jgi:hypothetical protein
MLRVGVLTVRAAAELLRRDVLEDIPPEFAASSLKQQWPSFNTC